jgi:Mn2+/Fe2+ NRAMP family transporter
VRRFQPALVGGLFIGVLSSLPFISAANACCCLWVVAGGALTAYLLQQRLPEPIESSEAALQGLVAGAIGGVIYIVVLAMMLTAAGAGAAVADRVRDALEQNSQIPPELRDRIMGVVASGVLPVLIAVFAIPMYAIVAMLGSLLGFAVFRKKAAPPATPHA